MSNNLNYQLPASGIPVSTQETTIGGVIQHLQRMKLGVGANGQYQGDLTFGSAPAASSIPVAIANDQIVPINHSTSTMYEVSGNANTLNGTPIASTSISNYRWVAVQLTGINEVTFEASNDNTNWFPIALLNTKSAWQVVSTTTPGIYYGPLCYKNFRLRISNFITGTTSAIAEFSATPGSLHGVNARTELGYPRDATDSIPSGINAGQVISLDYAYHGPSNAWHRDQLSATNPNVNDWGLYRVVRPAGIIYNGLGRKNTYMATSTNAVSMNNTQGSVTSLAYLWHGNSLTQQTSIQKILVNCCNPAAASGDFNLIVTRITNENSTPGGTSNTVISTDSSQTASSNVFRSGANAPTRQTGDAISMVFPADLSGPIELTDILEGKGFVCLPGIGEGWEVRAVAGSGLTPSPKFTTTYIWTEE